MMKNILTLLIGIPLAFNRLAFASAGTSGAAFLKIIPTARIAGLGGTSSNLTGVESIFTNPAGLGAVEKSEISLSNVTWIESINYSNVAAAERFSFGTLGVGVNYLSVPTIVKYDEGGNKLNETFAPNDMAITLGYSRNAKISGWESNLGGALKFIKSTIDDMTAQSVALDLGCQLKIPDTAVGLAFAVQNLGTEIKFDQVDDPLPLNFKLGAKYSLALKGQEINFVADLNYTNDTQFWATLGIEYLRTFSGISTALRLGYCSNTTGLSGYAGLAAGLGLGWHNYMFDYAFAPYGDLGNSHRISFGVKF